MDGVVWVVYGLLILACGINIGWVGAGIAAAARAAQDEAELVPDVVQHGTLAEHRRWAERQLAAAAPATPLEYEGRHQAGIATGTSNQRAQVDRELERWRSLDVTGELERILSGEEPDEDMLIIESPTGFAAWMAETRQPWGVAERTGS